MAGSWCWLAWCLDDKIMEIYAGNKMYATNLLEEAASLGLGKGWPDEVPHKEDLALLQQKRKNLHVPGKAINVRLEDDWSKVTRSEDPNPWMMANLTERQGRRSTQDWKTTGDEEGGAQSLDDGEHEGELLSGEAGG